MNQPTVTLYQGDCLEFMKTLAPGVVDAVVTDPPYGMNWDTNTSRFSGAKNHTGSEIYGRDDWKPIHNDNRPFDPAPFLDFPAVVMWGSNHYANRLPTGTTLVWVKKPEHLFNTFLSDAEIAWMKGGYGVYAFKKNFPPPMRMTEGNGKVLHPNQKPVGLFRWCCEMAKLSEGATVFDPFMGSGTAGVACLQMGINYIGCEIDPGYFEIAKKRIETARMQLRLEI